jgi:hypothetical protein
MLSWGSSCGGLVYCPLFRFRQRKRPSTMSAMSAAPPTPTPIPTFAPVERPEEVFSFALAVAEDEEGPEVAV